MDRRNFLRLFSSASLLSIAPTQALANIEAGSFYSEAFKTSFKFPPSWYHSSIEETKANLSKQTFEDTLLWEDSEQLAPLASFSRYKEPHQGMNPLAIVYADRIPSWIESPIELAHNYIESFGEVVLDGKCLQAPQQCMFGGKEAVRTLFTYTAKIESENFVHKVADESYILFHGDYVLWFLFEESNENSETAQAEFELIKKTVEFLS